MKKILNVNSLKFQQSMINVKFLNIHAFFLDMCLLKILNLKKEIKEKDLIFMKIDVTQQ